MESEVLSRLFEANLTGAIAVIVVLAFRRPTRRIAGAQIAYQLWLIVPVAMLAVLLPPRIIFIPAPMPISVPLPLELVTAGLRPSAGIPIPISPPRQHSYYLISLWLFGAAISFALLLIGQLRARAQFGKITADSDNPQLGRASNSRVGPALLGVLRPKIVIPNDFEDRFDENERAMILAHERTHLAMGHAAINGLTALVGVLNWFNPLLHLAARIARIDQELACDASVIRRFPEKRQSYAHALLKTQIAFASLPLGCNWPVRSPHRLEERIEMLAEGNPGRKRLIIGGAVVAVLTAGAGLAAWASEPPVEKFAETKPSGTTQATPALNRPGSVSTVGAVTATPGNIAQLRAEQERPRQVVSFDPAHFDRYVGYYELPSEEVFRITRIGDKFFSQLTGQAESEIYPESETKFFSTVVASQFTFLINSQGTATALVLHQNGLEQPARRINKAEASSQVTALDQRIATNTPSPGTGAFLQRFLKSLEVRAPDYSELSPLVATAARAQQDALENLVKNWGPVQSIGFSAVTPQGMDRYNVAFKYAEIPTIVGPLGPDGKITAILFMSQAGRATPNPELANRIKNNRPIPGVEAWVRRRLISLQTGKPNYDGMAPGLAMDARLQLPQTRQRLEAFGPLKTVRFVRVDPQGRDVYEADFERNRAEVAISPLNSDGKIWNLVWQNVP